MSATNSTGRANHSLLMTFCSPHAVIDFDVPPTASHKNNSAKLVRANAVAFTVPTPILRLSSGRCWSSRGSRLIFAGRPAKMSLEPREDQHLPDDNRRIGVGTVKATAFARTNFAELFL